MLVLSKQKLSVLKKSVPKFILVCDNLNPRNHVLMRADSAVLQNTTVHVPVILVPHDIAPSFIRSLSGNNVYQKTLRSTKIIK